MDKQRLIGLIVVLFITIIGVKLIVASHAQSPSLTFSASSGTIASPAVAVPDTSASSGKVVRFGTMTALSPPSVPTNRAYLGAWVNPNQITGGGTGCTGSYTEPGCQEIAALPNFNQQNGKALSILHVYTPFNTTANPLSSSVPLQTLTNIRANGSVPLIDWNCTDPHDTNSLATINSGADDNYITAYAQTLKSFGSPVFLRWYWEMNLSDPSNINCGGFDTNGSNAGSTAYKAAWIHIWNIFHQQGATNVAFVWCPSVHNTISASITTYAQYYPGANYVDWIGVDGYDRSPVDASDFSSIFGTYYSTYSNQNKPIMVAETAAAPDVNTNSSNQSLYLQGIQSSLPTSFTGIKAVVYFDSDANNLKWSLQGAGITSFSALSHDSYFSYKSQ